MKEPSEESVIYTDVVIIGAGPAGMSAAISLQRAGISNAVIDKKSFPREKTCGGLVTYKTRKILMKLLDVKSFNKIAPAFCGMSKTAEIYDRSKRLAVSGLSKRLLFVKREKFDHFLVQHYKRLGGSLYENEKKYELDHLKRIVKLDDGRLIRYRNLIAADGALSATREAIGYPKQSLSFCLETHLPKEMVINPRRTKIYFGVVENGYAWMFPSGNEVCIGLGGDYDEATDYRLKLEGFLRGLGIEPDKCKLQGAFVPDGSSPRQNLDIKNAVLIGDAGGFVDPLYGEGLYFALTSGMAAAKARIDGGKDFKQAFIENMASSIKTIEQGYRLKRLFFKKRAQRMFAKKVYGKNVFLGFYCDNQVSEYRYSYTNLLKLYLDYKKRFLTFVRND